MSTARSPTASRLAVASRHMCSRVATAKVCIVGGGMVGTATALNLADKGIHGVSVVCGRAANIPSSSNDVSRLVGTGGAADEISVRQFRDLEERSGVGFWSDCGLLEVDVADAAALQVPSQLQEHLRLDSFFDERGLRARMFEHGRGWIDPRALTRAGRVVAERSGAQWIDGEASSITRGSDGSGLIVSTREGSTVHADVVVLALGAFAPHTPSLTAGLSAVPLRTLMWGKTLYQCASLHICLCLCLSPPVSMALHMSLRNLSTRSCALRTHPSPCAFALLTRAGVRSTPCTAAPASLPPPPPASRRRPLCLSIPPTAPCLPQR